MTDGNDTVEDKISAVHGMIVNRWSEHAPEIQLDKLAAIGVLERDGLVVDTTEDHCCKPNPLAGFLVTRKWLGLFSIAELRSGRFKLKKRIRGLTKKAIMEKAKAYTCAEGWEPEKVFVNLIGVRVFARTPESIGALETCGS